MYDIFIFHVLLAIIKKLLESFPTLIWNVLLQFGYKKIINNFAVILKNGSHISFNSNKHVVKINFLKKNLFFLLIYGMKF